MTRKRNDENSTPFGLWIREVKELDSSLGFTGNDLDFVWYNYKNGLWMFLETKTFMASLTPSQSQIYPIINRLCDRDIKYRGFYAVKFENTTSVVWTIYASPPQIIGLPRSLPFRYSSSIPRTFSVLLIFIPPE